MTPSAATARFPPATLVRLALQDRRVWTPRTVRTGRADRMARMPPPQAARRADVPLSPVPADRRDHRVRRVERVRPDHQAGRVLMAEAGRMDPRDRRGRAVIQEAQDQTERLVLKAETGSRAREHPRDRRGGRDHGDRLERWVQPAPAVAHLVAPDRLELAVRPEPRDLAALAARMELPERRASRACSAPMLSTARAQRAATPPFTAGFSHDFRDNGER